jgi:hypothetical protein
MSKTLDSPDLPKRRWFQFSVRGLLLLVALVAIVLPWPTTKRREIVTRLAEFDSSDIRAINAAEQSEVKAIIRDLTGEDKSVFDLDYYEPRYVWRLRQGRPWLAVFEVCSITNASESARVIFFDRGGNEIARRELPIEGKLIWIIGAAVEEHGQGFPLLVLDASRPLAGSDIRRRYYAMQDCELELVRLEGPQGLPVVCHWRPEGIVQWVRSESTLTSGVAGPQIANAADRREWRTVFVEEPPPTVAQWREEVASTDAKRILRALLYAPTRRDGEEPLDAPTKKRIEELAGDTNLWIAQAAQEYRSRMIREAARRSDREVAR